MILTRSADYALRALIHLAQVPKGRAEPLEAIVAAQRVPPALLSKILQTLVRGGIVRSQKGYGGGYALQADPHALTLKAVVELIDGPFTVFECLVDAGFCDLCSNCALRRKFEELQGALVRILGSATVGDCLPQDGQPVRRLARASGSVADPPPCSGPSLA